MKLMEAIDFNPKESLPKNSQAKKIGMEKLSPFYKFIDSYEYEKYSGGSKFRNGDTIVARITPCLENGKTAFIDFLDEKEIAFGSTEFIVMRAKEGIAIPEYVYYLAISPWFRNKAISLMTGTSGRQRVQVDPLKLEDYYIPSISEQKKIVKLLSNIDNKIKLNNKINNNLYKLAVKYLDEKVNSNKVMVRNFAKIQGGYAFKSNNLIEKHTNNRIIKIKNLSSKIKADVINTQFIENKVIEKIDNKFRLKKGDVVIAMTGAELGKTGFIYGSDTYYLNQRVGVIRGKSKESELYLNILFLSEKFQQLLNSKGYGSAQPNVSTTDIENILINDIFEENLKEYYERIKPIYDRIVFNSDEIIYLEKLRDTLLPKLMNGKIDLDSIEI